MKPLRRVIEFMILYPLSVLRILLPWPYLRVLYNYLKSIPIAENGSYTDAHIIKTWWIELLPDSMIVFDEKLLFTYSILLIFCVIGASVGLFGRLNLLILALLGFLIGGLTEAWGFFDHNLSLSSQVILILALVPQSMNLSVDSWVIEKFNSKKMRLNKSSRWGVNLILILLALTYFTAGISKLKYGGSEWLNGSTLTFYLKNHPSDYNEGSRQLLIGNDQLAEKLKWKDQFAFHAHTYGNYQSNKWLRQSTDWIASRPYLVIFLSYATIFFEIFGFILFVNSRFRNLYLVSAILMHTTIGLMMGLYFNHYRLICFCLIDWSYFLNRIKLSDLLGIELKTLN